jgi:hypothetical protein
MARMPIAGRIGVLVATGAVGVGLVAAGPAAAKTKSIPSKCPTKAAVSMAVGTKMSHLDGSKPGRNISCGYYDAAGKVFVTIETLHVGKESKSTFYKAWAQTAKDNKSKFRHFKAGEAAGYFTQKHNTVEGHPTLEAEVLKGQEQLTVSVNGSVKHVEKLARSFS